jgi:hypothetical protein
MANAALDAFSNLTRRGMMGGADAEIERKVSLAARNLCYGVQRIVMAAKGKSGVEWKGELLTLLGGSDDENPKEHCDMDILLVAPRSEKFVLRCLENELPPNMIHCLRLLRVLELQHATQQQKDNEAQGKKDQPIKPISSRATAKVSQLLCTLCTDPTVGEQLRPHLFGLLALSGASYPASGVHVAKAASQVIIAFSEHCLSQSLVWFLHDRKMIIHMTDDIKELCGLNSAQNPTSSKGMSLYGTDAEEHGLWAISISTIIHLVVCSCRHDCRELLKDFEAAKGNQVLMGAIVESKSKHGKKLMELVPLLVMCRASDEQEDKGEISSMVDTNNHKLALNPSAFEIMEELMYRSIPLLQVYVEEHGKRPVISDEQSIRALAEYSLKVAAKIRFAKDEDAESSLGKNFDIPTDLLLACLNLYSEHMMNYDLVEETTHILTFFILALPTFKDENLKVLIMKTIEFVVTGVTGSNALQPFTVLSETFLAICKALLKGGDDDTSDADKQQLLMDGLFADTDLINESLEKLFQFDNRVGPAIIRSGTITHIVDDITSLLLTELSEKKDTWLTTFEEEGEVFAEPPPSTPLDSVIAAICRVLALIMGQQSKGSISLLSTPEVGDPQDLNYLLVTAVKELGDESANAASCVFESILASREDLEFLRADMEFCLRLIDYFANIMGRVCGVPAVAQKFASKKSITRSAAEEIQFEPTRALNNVYLRRVIGLYTMIKNVLESSSLAKEAFRLSCGFESMTKVILSLGGLASQEGQDSDITQSLLSLFETMLSVVDAGIGFNSRESPDMNDFDMSSKMPVTLPAETLVDPVSTQHSPPKAAAQNLYYLRLKAFYLDFAVAISQTKILENTESGAIPVLELAMSHMDPSFSLTRVETDKGAKIQLMRNPDAARLVLGLALFLPNTKEGGALAKRSFDQIIRLCDPSRLGSTLTQIADCGLIWSITNPREFSSVLDDTSHPLYTRFTLLLRRIAGFSMSYNDFVSIIRGIAGPLLKDEKADSRIRLPVISSSVRRRTLKHIDDVGSEAFREKDADFCRRLESLCAVAERGERVPYTTLGGDSINTLSVLLHKTKVEDRLHKAAEDGRLNFLEIDCMDSSSLKPGGFLSAGVAAPGSSGGERVWTPMATSGFSFSVWFRYPKLKDESREGHIYLFDMANPTVSTSDGAHTPHNALFLSIWYDLQAQRFNVLSSTSYRGEPTCFPVSPLVPGVWHHILLTYAPTKRTMMGRKSVFVMYVDGRPLEAEVKIESVNLAPNAKVIIGAPNPSVAVSGVVRGMIPIWELGPCSMLSTVLMELDATAIFIHGPDFQGLFWGDRPQRLSLSATGSAAFALLAETGEPGSVASALRRREIARLEAAGTVSREMGLGGPSDADNDSLASLGLLCTIPPDSVVFAYRAASWNHNALPTLPEPSQPKKRNWSEKLINMARINASNEFVSTDAAIYGKAGVVNPRCFADNVQWAGGPQILMPLIFAAKSPKSLALALRLIRASTNRHPPNLEAMQGGGGFQMLAVLIQGKKFVDEKVLDQAFAFAVHGFVPATVEEVTSASGAAIPPTIPPASDFWVFSDLDAMKQLLLNHQVWDLKNSGPELPLRLISYMNGLVGQKSIHKAFNSRRLHLVGIVRWTLHLMIEASELYTAGEMAKRNPVRRHSNSEDSDLLSDSGGKGSASVAVSSAWYSEAPNADAVAVGGDPDNPLLHACKTLLRRVLTFMLTPGDLDAIAETTMHTVSVGGSSNKMSRSDSKDDESEQEKLLPGPVTRIYLLRLIEELIVDGVNEIVASGMEKKGGEAVPNRSEVTVQPHAGGIANPSQTYLSIAMMGGTAGEGQVHPKHQQAQNFLSAFAGVFSPVWFAALLEGCHEEATASAVLRLMILMLQSSPAFAAAFETQGGFAPLILSIPKFSTCSSIAISLLSQLLHVSILHLPCFPILDAGQLNEVFESERDLAELMSKAYGTAAGNRKRDPACGIFALLAECLGRNIQLAPFHNELGQKARQTNMAILELLQHRHNLSPSFQEFCREPDFIEPLAQTLCLVYDERLQRLQQVNKVQSSASTPSSQERGSRRGSLCEVPGNVSPMERFIGGVDEEAVGTGFGMVQLLRMVVSKAVVAGPVAPPLVHSLFFSFPIHASAEEVGAYQLVLIDICRSTIEDAIDLGDAVALASSIGVCSVLVDSLMRGFFTSEPTLLTANMTLTLLKDLASPESAAAANVGNAELNMIIADAAHIARLACISALRRSRSLNAEDLGDPDLQVAVIRMIAKSIHPLMTVPKPGLTGRRMNSSLHPSPATSSKLYPLWASASLSRCAAASEEFLYPDLSKADEPLRMFIASLMVEVALLLNDSRDDVREAAVSIVVALLQQRRGIMSGLLIKDIQRGDRMETIDVMNRGGFGALLVAHEVAMSGGGGYPAKKNYASFFEWFERNQQMVQLVFDDIQTESNRIFPGLVKGAATPTEAVEIQQQLKVMKMATSETSDRTIVGGLERAELAQRCVTRTIESHVHWKRQGFDDLASGAMQWKFLLRRLKGSCSIWEGGPRFETRSLIARHQHLYAGLVAESENVVVAVKEEFEEGKARELVTRWKLDLTEGCERQRRRLLPNYEFHSLYNVDENDDFAENDDDDNGNVDAEADDVPRRAGRRSIITGGEMQSGNDSATEFFISDGMEATAALLKDLNLKKVNKKDVDDEYLDDVEDDVQTEATTATGGSSIEGESVTKEEVSDGMEHDLKKEGHAEATEDVEASESHDHHEAENASSYELITGLLQAGDWPEESYNVRRCTGLEVRKALILWCRDAIYVIDGFEQTEGEGLEGRITRVEKEESSYNVNLRPKDFKVSDDEADSLAGGSVNEEGGKSEGKNKTTKKPTQESSNEVTYQHRSQRIAFSDLHSVFRRRYQLQQSALEFYDIHNNGTLIAFANHTEREGILSKVLAAPLPNSIFSSSYGTSINYKKFMSSWKAKIVSQWVNGKMTNFEFLMHLNSFAGRTYNDLTQYPVFPWVIADYDSEELDLDDPKTYRDLSKPMGGLSEDRAQQFRERYEALEQNYFNEDEPPPFHYGTHYSCAAYVLYYLMRLEPFSRLALTLQGGRFDVADRLFHNVGSSYKSASQENLQDVRELIPEFFYLPDFLSNTNHFDFGITQKGKTVHDATLPKWAKGDPSRFIRINRQALESDYVSKHLHLWIDLIFGCKQRGEEAVKALNIFVHVTYEGEVDLDSMTDPVQRESTIAQIQNFGQTPSRLERKPFPQRFVFSSLKNENIDFGSLSYLAPLTPPFCIVGAAHRCKVKRISSDTCKLGFSGQRDKAVGDMCLVKGQIVGVGRMCALNIPAKTYFRFGSPNNGLSVHVASLTARNRELNKTLSIHDGLHRAEISVAKASLDGQWLVTACIDSTVRVWKYENRSVRYRATLAGHGGWKITCLDISTVFGTIVTGCAQGRVLLWDLRTLTFVRRLDHTFKDEKDFRAGHVRAASSVSINHKNGNIVTLVGPHLSVFDVNGKLQGTENSLGARPTCAVATDCPEWQEKGIVAVTGHVNGEVRFWRLNYETGELTVRELMVDIEHRCEITALRVTGVDRQDTLLVGDKSGKMSVCKTTQLENMSSREVAEVTMELRSGLAKVAQEDVGGGLGSGLVKVAQQGKEVGGDIASGIRNLLPGQNPTDNETL